MKTFQEYLEIIQEASKEKKMHKIFVKKEGSQLMEIVNLDGLTDYVSKNPEFEFKIHKEDELFKQIKNMYAKSSQISKTDKKGYVTFISNEKASKFDDKELSNMKMKMRDSEEDEM